uniref:Uncharacterized protein n=1 Tax=Acrobeloides nanus TaxID=290746 RepID=A0A914E9S0_9BILA
MQRKTEWLQYVPVFSSFYYKIKQNIDRVFEFLERQVNEHLNEIDYNSEPTDFVDAYLRKKAKLDQEGGPHYYSHITSKDVEILGYKLPKGTNIVPQISVVMSDSKITATSGKPPEVVRKLANTLAPPTFTCDIEARF